MDRRAWVVSADLIFNVDPAASDQPPLMNAIAVAHSIADQIEKNLNVEIILDEHYRHVEE